MTYKEIITSVIKAEKECESIDNIQKRLNSIFDAFLNSLIKILLVRLVKS